MWNSPAIIPLSLPTQSPHHRWTRVESPSCHSMFDADTVQLILSLPAPDMNKNTVVSTNEKVPSARRYQLPADSGECLSLYPYSVHQVGTNPGTYNQPLIHRAIEAPALHTLHPPPFSLQT